MNTPASKRNRALVFDFDGLIVDTERATYEVWRALYREYNAELTVTDWLQAVGHVGNFDPRHHLNQTLGRALDWQSLNHRIEHNIQASISQLAPLPGVYDLMVNARESGWKIGVASNSDLSWVGSGLARLDLAHLVHTVRTRDDVTRHKPHPDVYLAVMEALDADPSSSIAFEDSAPGAEAARAAGLYVIAVPNSLTRHMPIPCAHETLTSLEHFQLPAH